MCDYSIVHNKTRPAVVGEKLITKAFGAGTSGFAGVSDKDTLPGDATAVCLLPGTELAFDAPVKQSSWLYDTEPKTMTTQVARFRQIDKEFALIHHDALEFGEGEFVKLTSLAEGQIASVLQLPAAPKNEAEAEEQRRLEVVG